MAQKFTDFRDQFKNVDDYYQNFKDQRSPSLIPDRKRPLMRPPLQPANRLNQIKPNPQSEQKSKPRSVIRIVPAYERNKGSNQRSPPKSRSPVNNQKHRSSSTIQPRSGVSGGLGNIYLIDLYWN